MMGSPYCPSDEGNERKRTMLWLTRFLDPFSMKITVYISVRVFLVFLSASLLASDAMPGTTNENATKVSSPLTLIAYETMGKHYYCTVTDLKFFGSPRWAIENSEPPLSPRSALELAKKEAQILEPDTNGFRVIEVSLKQIVNVWFYVVTLERKTPVIPTYYSKQPLKIAILMDGTVAERHEVK
ncbi:MAG TPA: hypothetical protein VF988_04110 [Verrucomicrobiae bacterium]